MRKHIGFSAIPLIVVLGGCQFTGSKGEQAERQYEIIDQAAGEGESAEEDRCLAGTKVAQAYLEDENIEKYKSWKLTSDITCNNLRLNRQLRDNIGQ